MNRQVPHRRREGARPTCRESGTVTLEVIFLIGVVAIPLFYLVATLGQAQAGAFAASAAAREAGRAFVTAPNEAAAFDRAWAAGTVAAGSFGTPPAGLDIQITCSHQVCLTAGEWVEIRVEVRVELPLVPDFIAASVPTDIVLESVHVEAVDAFGARP